MFVSHLTQPPYHHGISFWQESWSTLVWNLLSRPLAAFYRPQPVGNKTTNLKIPSFGFLLWRFRNTGKNNQQRLWSVFQKPSGILPGETLKKDSNCTHLFVKGLGMLPFIPPGPKRDHLLSRLCMAGHWWCLLSRACRSGEWRCLLSRACMAGQSGCLLSRPCKGVPFFCLLSRSWCHSYLLSRQFILFQDLWHCSGKICIPAFHLPLATVSFQSLIQHWVHSDSIILALPVDFQVVIYDLGDAIVQAPFWLSLGASSFPGETHTGPPWPFLPCPLLH